MRKAVEQLIERHPALAVCADSIEAMITLAEQTYERGGTLFACGNGGSAADSQHLATELVGRFEQDNRLPAVALTTDTSTLTALANDFGFDEVFSRQVQALVRPADALVALSTSGNSPSILAAVRQAREQGARVLGLTGKDGGQMAALCDHCLVVPSPRTCRIQEGHITIGHILCELIEEACRQGRIPSQRRVPA